VDSDPAADRRLWEAWNEGQGNHKTFEDLAKAKGISKLEVKRAIDRHRKRLGDGKK